MSSRRFCIFRMFKLNRFSPPTPPFLFFFSFLFFFLLFFSSFFFFPFLNFIFLNLIFYLFSLSSVARFFCPLKHFFKRFKARDKSHRVFYFSFYFFQTGRFTNTFKSPNSFITTASMSFLFCCGVTKKNCRDRRLPNIVFLG